MWQIEARCALLFASELAHFVNRDHSDSVAFVVALASIARLQHRIVKHIGRSRRPLAVVCFIVKCMELAQLNVLAALAWSITRSAERRSARPASVTGCIA